jgi:hypothetical protein
MSKLFKSTAKSQKAAKTKKQERYWASDAVERIARRTPALFKKNPVPSIGSRSLTFRHPQAGGMA